mmetsp:Transcript_2108/g.5582  ORF Transcript_2108/g.5582 Transcript_2108/m.5582 type:complete len:201 (+) Transcript_2108:1001-1603(+)
MHGVQPFGGSLSPALDRSKFQGGVAECSGGKRHKAKPTVFPVGVGVGVVLRRRFAFVPFVVVGLVARAIGAVTLGMILVLIVVLIVVVVASLVVVGINEFHLLDNGYGDDNRGIVVSPVSSLRRRLPSQFIDENEFDSVLRELCGDTSNVDFEFFVFLVFLGIRLLLLLLMMMFLFRCGLRNLLLLLFVVFGHGSLYCIA